MFRKFANAIVTEPVIELSDWKTISPNSFGNKTAAANFNKIAVDSSKYLLSQCTIMASVMTEDEPHDYLIKPECSHLVNNNSDAWTNEVLHLAYGTFKGAFNFLEHFQNAKAAKGHILDAVLRKVGVAPPDVWVYYCDILVATDMTHEKLIEDIRSEKTRYMSMGCVTDLVICSFCGTKVTDSSTYCDHLQFQKDLFLPDDNDIPRRVAELCGHKSLPNGGVRFVEASWVSTPAFPGASMRGIIADEWIGPKTKYTAKSAQKVKTASSILDIENWLENENRY
jgi:hypothetical protein